MIVCMSFKLSDEKDAIPTTKQKCVCIVSVTVKLRLVSVKSGQLHNQMLGDRTCVLGYILNVYTTDRVNAHVWSATL